MPKKALYRTAFHRHVKPSPLDILAFHQAHFGDARMENEAGNDGGDGGAGGDGGTPQVGPNGYPEATPVKDMTAEHQAAYWKHQSRKHEQAAKDRADYEAIKAERDQLKAATLSDAEKAVEEARKDERTKAEAETAARYVNRLVDAEFKASLAGRRTPEQIATLLEGINHKNFLTDTGEVDTSKVSQHADVLAPAGTKWPDMGGGKRGAEIKDSGYAAGAQRYADRAAKKK